MSRSHLFGIALAAMSSLVLLAENAPAQQKSPKEQLVGTWTMTSNTTTRPDGSKVETFGPGAKGIVIFEPNGYRIIQSPGMNLRWRVVLPPRAAVYSSAR